MCHLAKLLEVKTLLKLLKAKGKPKLVTVDFKDTVRSAIRLMIDNDFSQLPVTKKDNIVGMLSFASIVKTLYLIGTNSKKRTQHWQEWKVEDVMEKPVLKDYHEDLFDLIETLARDSFVVIRTKDKKYEILTSFDVLHYFKELAAPFLFLNDIENSLRATIQSKFDEQTFEAKAMSIFNNYEKREQKVPKKVDEMCFGDYITFISSCWTAFKQLLGNKDLFLGYSETARKIRNDVCHFRNPICRSNKEALERFLNWLKEKTNDYLRPDTE